jgi:serine/threonine protein phosphatase 1
MNEKYFDYTIIHGHTPINKIISRRSGTAPLFKKDANGNILTINVDTGCVYGDSLSAVLTENGLDFESETVKCKK